jgi:hypothetical protein
MRPLTAAELESLSKALADTVDGLTGSEIGRLLVQAKIEDPDPTMTKWKRLYNALVCAQNGARSATPTLNFIHHALAPARYVGKPVALSIGDPWSTLHSRLSGFGSNRLESS